MEQKVKLSLRAARVNARLNQRQAAARLSIGVSTLQGYENGRRIPRWDIVRRMEELYGVGSTFLHISEETAGREG